MTISDTSEQKYSRQTLGTGHVSLLYLERAKELKHFVQYVFYFSLPDITRTGPRTITILFQIPLYRYSVQVFINHHQHYHQWPPSPSPIRHQPAPTPIRPRTRIRTWIPSRRPFFPSNRPIRIPLPTTAGYPPILPHTPPAHHRHHTAHKHHRYQIPLPALNHSQPAPHITYIRRIAQRQIQHRFEPILRRPLVQRVRRAVDTRGERFVDSLPGGTPREPEHIRQRRGDEDEIHRHQDREAEQERRSLSPIIPAPSAAHAPRQAQPG